MLKKWIFYTSLIAVVGFLSSGFKPFLTQRNTFNQQNKEQGMDYLFPSLETENYTLNTTPFAGKFFIGFKEALAFKESQGHYNKINSLGYLGKYQFGQQTLKTVGVKDSLGFMNNPKLQEKAFIALLKRNKWELKDEIQKYSGKIIDGVRITESGILAAAHLGGVGSVKLFLKTNGKRKCKDDYGTSIKKYMEDFGGYETAGIVADSNARVK